MAGVLIASSIATLVGVVLLYFKKRNDQRNYIIQKATPLPLKLANVRDDVWLEGRADCDYPLRAPFFDARCLHYHYRVEEKRTRRSADNERTETYWVTVESDTESVRDFQIKSGNERITVIPSQASFHGLKSEYTHRWNRRYNLRYFPYPSVVNAIGSISERKTHLEPYGNIPLIVTTQNRDTYIKQAESSETFLLYAGFFVLWAGLLGLFYGLFTPVIVPTYELRQFHLAPFMLALVISIALLSIFYAINTYNRLIIYQNRLNNAWKQVDVDLAMRYQLIPQLVEVSKAYMTHEKSMLDQLVNLRNASMQKDRAGKIADEPSWVKRVDQVIFKIETYPELKAHPVIQKVTRELTAIEEKIAHARITYNEAVREYNDCAQSFPNILVAEYAGFKQQVHFSLED